MTIPEHCFIHAETNHISEISNMSFASTSALSTQRAGDFSSQIPEEESPSPLSLKRPNDVYSISADKKPKQILFIADDWRVSSNFSRALTQQGVDVITTEPGKASIEIFHRQKDTISLVLLYMMGSGIQAVETFSFLLSIKQDAKIIILTGSTFTQEVKYMLNNGALCYFSKPYSIPLLSRAFNEYLS
jgi:CheY-like chemotaxis protein